MDNVEALRQLSICNAESVMLADALYQANETVASLESRLQEISAMCLACFDIIAVLRSD